MEKLAPHRERLVNQISNPAPSGSTEMDKLERLRERLEKQISNSAPIEPTEKIFRLPTTPRSAATRSGGAALDLVYEAAEVVRGIENRASETEKRAQNLVQMAVEQLHRAEKRIQELEAERQTAESRINEAVVKIQEAGEALELERARVKAAEDQVCQLELHARSAEAHAIESENTLARIEDAIRTQLLGKGESPSTNQNE